MATRPSAARRTLAAIDRAGVWLTGAGAALVAALQVAALVLAGREILGTGPLTVSGLALQSADAPQLGAASPQITEAGYDTATVTVAQAPATARWLLWGEVAATSLAAVGICLALVWLCVRVVRHRPFGRSVNVALLTTAVLVLVGGLATDFLGAVGRAELVHSLGASATSGDHGLVPLALELNLAPVGVALALGVLGVAFEVGARLQRDTEGLV